MYELAAMTGPTFVRRASVPFTQIAGTKNRHKVGLEVVPEAGLEPARP